MTEREHVAQAIHEQRQRFTYGRIALPWADVRDPDRDETLQEADAALAAIEAWNVFQYRGR